MTWLLGGEGSWSAFLLADTRVTLPADAGYRDWVRKVYQIGSHLIVGCAGSTKIGFEIIAKLQHDPELAGQPALSEILRETLPRKLIDVFSSAEPEAREDGCEMIFAGCHLRSEDLRPGMPPQVAAQISVVKFAAPGFSPQFAWPPHSLLCSGVREDRLRSHVVPTQLKSMELSSPTSLAQFHEWRLREALSEAPQPGVSDEFVLGVVNYMGAHVQDAVSFSKTENGVVRHGPRARLASTWDELMRFCDSDEEIRALEKSGRSLRNSTM